jgi:hypothetical protein
MKKLIFSVLVFSTCCGAFAQSDSVSSNAVREAAKLEALAQLTASQKTEILKILQEYYQHKEDLVQAKEAIVKAKENLKNLLDLVRDEEQNFDENLTYILTQHQYERCTPYFKARKEKIDKANGTPKKTHKVSPKAVSTKGS